ncbi:transferase, partial [Streptomyces sp. NPDC047968]
LEHALRPLSFDWYQGGALDAADLCPGAMAPGPSSAEPAAVATLPRVWLSHAEHQRAGSDASSKQPSPTDR